MGFKDTIRSMFGGSSHKSLLSDPVRAVLRAAEREAKRLNHRFVDVEHLLLGLLAVDSKNDVITVRNQLTPGHVMVTIGHPPQTDCFKLAIEIAIAARPNKEVLVEIHHLRAGLYAADPEKFHRLTGIDPSTLSAHQPLRFD